VKKCAGAALNWASGFAHRQASWQAVPGFADFIAESSTAFGAGQPGVDDRSICTLAALAAPAPGALKPMVGTALDHGLSPAILEVFMQACPYGGFATTGGGRLRARVNDERGCEGCRAAADRQQQRRRTGELMASLHGDRG
jgi:hypothetical protein